MPQNTVPRLPVVGDIVRSRGRLVGIITPPPVQPPTEYIFENVDYKVSIWSAGHMIKEVATYNNLYIDSLDSAIATAKKTANLPRWNIPQSGMRVVVSEVVHKTRMQVNASMEREFYDKEIVALMTHSNYFVVEDPTRREIWSSDNQDAAPTPGTKYAWWNEPRWKKP